MPVSASLSLLEASSHLGECVTSSNAPRITINYFLVATHLPPPPEACPPCFLRFVLLFLALYADTCVSESFTSCIQIYYIFYHSFSDIFNNSFASRNDHQFFPVTQNGIFFSWYIQSARSSIHRVGKGRFLESLKIRRYYFHPRSR